MSAPNTDAPALRVVALLTRRELTARIRSKTFVILTVVFVVAVVGFTVVMHLLSDRTSTVKVGLVPQTASISAPLRTAGEAVDVDITTREVASAQAGTTALQDGSVDAVVTEVGGTVQVQVNKSLDPSLESALSLLARQAALDRAVTDTGGDPAVVNRAMDAAQVKVSSLESVPKFQGERILLGILAGVLVYVALMVYGQSVAQGVIEEKTSRVVELLLATVRPWQLMLGKVLGIGAAGLLQMVAVAGAGLGAALGLGALTMPSGLAVGLVVWTLVWFVLGFVVYALLFAAAGAMVSRQEDAGGVTTPILMLIILPYVVGVSVLPAAPDNMLARVLSLIPLFSPTLMPIRIALGVVPVWELVFSVVLTLGLTVALVGLAGRVYANSVMRMGARVRLAQALRPL